MYKNVMGKIKNQTFFFFENFAKALCCAFDKSSTHWNLKEECGIDILKIFNIHING